MAPCDFNHLIFIGSAPWTFNFLDDNRFWLFLFNWISVIIKLFLLFFSSFFSSFFLLSSFFFCFWLFYWSFLSFIVCVSRSVLLCLIIRVTSLIHVIDWKNLIWMWIGRPYTKITIGASGGKIFTTKLVEIDNLNNFDVMSGLYYIMLIVILKAKYHEVAFT